MKMPVRLLIIEDNEDDTLLEVDEIRNAGHQIVYERIDTPAALRKALQSKEWDCIISDYSMPGFSGLEALQILKESDKDIPFILISGAIGEEIAVNAMKSGAHDYIMKSNLNRLVPALERELREAENRMQKKQAEDDSQFEKIMLRTLIDNLPDIIYVKNTDGCKIVSNTADVAFSGHSFENELLGKTDLEIFDNEFGKRRHATDLSVIQSGIPLFNIEEEFCSNDGTIRWFLSSRIPLRNEKKEITGLVGISHDITVRKRMEVALIENDQVLKKQNLEYEALNKEYSTLNEEITESLERIKQMNEELMISKNRAEESDKLKSSFLANMSHEIRTPLNAILGFSAFLKNPEISKNRTDEFVDIIEASGQQLLTIINDILEISQIEAGQIKIYNEPVNISKLLNELFVRYSKDTQSKNIDLVLNINKSSDDIITKTDANRIRQILSNLLNNAIKFTHEGKVEFAARATHDQVVFYVKDTGIGIASDDQSMIFQPFRQVESTMSRNYGGNGLGLSICKALVEKLDGKLTVQSIPGKGSTFTFSIPWVTDDLPTPEKETAEPIRIPRKYNWNKYVILIAEDEIFNYQFFEEILMPTHVKILHAKDGREAVQMVRDHPDISLVIMDLKMPGMDGYKASELIKQIRPALPVIAQTATVLDDIRNMSEQGHFDQYVSKPIEIKSFMEVIDNYLEN